MRDKKGNTRGETQERHQKGDVEKIIPLNWQQK
jgi:hypothetical protein